jgi:hypothetical protein
MNATHLASEKGRSNRLLWIVSCGLNVVLACALMIRALGLHEGPYGDPVRRVAQFFGAEGRAAERTIVQFHWSLLESTNYPDYIVNLRATGCPWSAIKDIVIGDVQRAYAPKFEALNREAWARAQNYWESPGVNDRAEEREQRRRYQALQAEKAEVIRQLLGVELEEEEAALAGWLEWHEVELAFLPKEKGAVIGELRLRYNAQVAQLSDSAGGRLQPDDHATLQRLNDKLADAVAKALTPVEKKEFDLRFSETANQLRLDLRGFQVTEQEFRTLFEIRQQSELAGAAADIVEKKIAEALGPERFAAYRRGRSGSGRE